MSAPDPTDVACEAVKSALFNLVDAARADDPTANFSMISTMACIVAKHEDRWPDSLAPIGRAPEAPRE